MRFPSVAVAARRAGATAIRFPLSLAAALVAAGVLMEAVEGVGHDWMPRLLAASLTGLALFTATTTASERLGLAPAARWTALGLGLAGLSLLYWSSLGWTESMAGHRWIQLGLAAHLLVAGLPFVRGGSTAGFWQFNRVLLLRYLLASLYTVVLWAGLAIALLALDQLLGVDVRNEWYPDLAILLGLVVHPWFVLAGIPRDFDALDRLDEYPIGLKVFTQFVLIPLVTVYLTILTLYLGKVIVTRTWPSGWIGWLVSSVSAVGVLALLLVHPIRDRADSRWVNGYARWFFVALLPSLGMLIAAISKRIGQYGVTERRYFLFALAVWLVGLAVYYGITASRNIKIIPWTLLAVTVLTLVGPWGAYAVSERSQLGRLDRFLAAGGMGRVGAATAAGPAADRVARREVAAILSYLSEAHGVGAVARATGLPPDSLGGPLRSGGDREAGRTALALLGLNEVDPRGGDPYYWIRVPSSGPVDVEGFTRLYPFSIMASEVLLGRDSLALRPDSTMRTVEVRTAGGAVAIFALGAVLDSVLAGRPTVGGGGFELATPLVLDATVSGWAFRLIVHDANGRLAGGRAAVQHLSGYLLTAPR